MEDGDSTKLKNLLTPLSSQRPERALSPASARLQTMGRRMSKVVGDGNCKRLETFLELSLLRLPQPETQ
jgi:hypothetical protein